MRQSSNIKRLYNRFKSNISGNIAIMFALSAAPMFLAAGAAVDFVRANNSQVQMQAALDAGALAAAASPDLSDEEREDLASAVFAKNFSAINGVTATTAFSIENGSISMSADMSMPTAFMRLAGLNTLDIGSSVTVSLPEMKSAEIVLALDYSGSMGEYVNGKQKYVAMQQAAVQMVEDLTAGEAADKVRFGLVPFSHHVNVTLPGKFVVGADATQNWTGCTQDRKHPHNLGVDTPEVNDDETKWGQPQASAHENIGCSGYAPRSLNVRPVSDQHDDVVSQLNDMVPYAWTHIALGFEFAWHLLSDSAPFTDVAANDDDATMKVIVLLTDGRQTEPAFGSGSSRTVSQGERNLESLCENAKSAGVRVITVAFDLQHQATENRLKGCATDPDKDFFIADDGAALANAFEEIRAELQQAIYISK